LKPELAKVKALVFDEFGTVDWRGSVIAEGMVGARPKTDLTNVEGALNRREIRRICSACNQQSLPDASSNRRTSRSPPAPP
jgi:hypothetical protein